MGLKNIIKDRVVNEALSIEGIKVFDLPNTGQYVDNKNSLPSISPTPLVPRTSHNYTKTYGGGSTPTTHDPDTGMGFTMPPNEPSNEDDINLIDRDWARSRFMTPNFLLTEVDAYNRYHTPATYKFVSTRLGEHIVMNPKPQFTRYADIKPLRRIHNSEVTLQPTTASLGMGRYYSESIDDFKQVLFLEFGVPEFNSLLTFFLRAVSYEDAYIAKHGALPIGYSIGNAIGTTARWILLPGLSALSAVLKAGMDIFGVFDNNTFSYYYLKPAMHLYWGTAGTILNMMASELGILNPIFMPDENTDTEKKIGSKVGIDQTDIAILKYMLPGIINTTTNQIDLYAVATKAQSIATKALQEEYRAIKGVTDGIKTKTANNQLTVDDISKSELLKKFANLPSVDLTGNSKLEPIDGETPDTVVKSYKDFVSKYFEGLGTKGTVPEEKSTSLPEQSNTDGAGSPGAPKQESVFRPNDDFVYDISPTMSEAEEGMITRYFKTAHSMFVDGGRWVPLHVDYVGEGSESFSSSTSDIETEGMIKQIGGQANTMRYNLAGGNLGGFVSDVVGTATNVLAGALDGATFGLSGVVAGLLGGGFIDLPKKWDDSSFSLPTVTYKIQLRSPYGNVWSQLQDIYIPLSLLIAGAAPLSAGKASYTSPFLCSAFCRGTQNVKLGMITDLSITRGTGNLGFDREWRPLGIDVSFTITDFSSIASAPISRSFLGGGLAELGDDTPFGKYIAMMCGRDIATNAFVMNKFKMKLSRMLMNISTDISPEAISFRTMDPLRGVAGMIFRDGNTMGSVQGN